MRTDYACEFANEFGRGIHTRIIDNANDFVLGTYPRGIDNQTIYTRAGVRARIDIANDTRECGVVRLVWVHEKSSGKRGESA